MLNQLLSLPALPAPLAIMAAVSLVVLAGNLVNLIGGYASHRRADERNACMAVLWSFALLAVGYLS